MFFHYYIANETRKDWIKHARVESAFPDWFAMKMTFVLLMLVSKTISIA